MKTIAIYSRKSRQTDKGKSIETQINLCNDYIKRISPEAERIKDNMRELAKTGRWLGGTTPTGYKSVDFELLNIKKINENNEIEGKTKKAYMLKEIDDEMILIKIIFQKFLELKSLSALETFTINNNLKTKNNKDFKRFSLKSMQTEWQQRTS